MPGSQIDAERVGVAAEGTRARGPAFGIRTTQIRHVALEQTGKGIGHQAPP
ncbi:MAG: hypothetical protein GKS05_02335 [Nitrospirales bacterium]|nr:hypothetical protein [Nitrospirales bacterium]